MNEFYVNNSWEARLDYFNLGKPIESRWDRQQLPAKYSTDNEIYKRLQAHRAKRGSYSLTKD